MRRTLQAINLGGQTVWVEVSDVAAARSPRSEFAPTSEGVNAVVDGAVEQFA